MITIKNKKIVITDDRVLSIAVFADKDSIYDNIKQELFFKVNKSSGDNWKLIHDGIKVMTIVEGTKDTVTTTIYKIEEFETEKEVFERIKTLGLEYTSPTELTEDINLKKEN